jgi:putative effector of murein hydrolase LrgA (UPF0299 family)
VDWSKALFQVIDLRSFSSVWYWIAVAVVWSSVSHYVLGVPHDLIMRARRKTGTAEQDVHDLVRINVNRMVHIGQTAGLLLAAFACFMLTSLAIMGFYYHIELAEALFLLALPLSIVGILTLSTAQRIARDWPEGNALYETLYRHRVWTQIIGMMAVFVTAMYGMYQNLGIVRGL